MVELRKICIILGASLPPPPFKRKLFLIPKLFPPAFLPPSRTGRPRPQASRLFAPFADFARGFPDIGTRFRRFFQALEASFADISRHWKRFFLPPSRAGRPRPRNCHPLSSRLPQVGRAVPASRFPSPGSAGTPRPIASYHLPLFLPHSSRGGGDATLKTASRTLKSAFAPSTLRRPQAHFSALFPAVHAHFSGNHLLAFLPPAGSRTSGSRPPNGYSNL